MMIRNQWGVGGIEVEVGCGGAGMYSGLRKRLSEPKISHPSYFVGLLLRGCHLPHPNYGHVVLAKPSPLLFYPISSCEVRSSNIRKG